MQFPFEQFSKRVRTVYPEVYHRLGGIMIYSLPEVLAVFRCFFGAYESYRSEVHPTIGNQQIVRIIEEMPCVQLKITGTYEVIDILSEEYPALIDAYFRTKFQEGCDYRINHFFSGQVRAVKWLEKLY